MEGRNKTVQDQNVEIESMKKTQMRGNLEMKNLETQTGTSEARLTNRIQAMEERTLSIDNMREEMYASAKQMLTLKKS